MQLLIKKVGLVRISMIKTRTPLFLFGCKERVCAGGHLLLRRRKFANLVETEEAAGEEVRAWACRVGERRW